mmetsp:Transcript_30746/g.44151  ORF Transcript_30746/g.44151 Transcript_30746/m.44151 type:complete len:81 (-) Transcript_30746:598-840(-)
MQLQTLELQEDHQGIIDQQISSSRSIFLKPNKYVSDLADREAQDNASRNSRSKSHHYDPETIRLRSSNSSSSSQPGPPPS